MVYLSLIRRLFPERAAGLGALALTSRPDSYALCACAASLQSCNLERMRILQQGVAQALPSKRVLKESHEYHRLNAETAVGQSDPASLASSRALNLALLFLQAACAELEGVRTSDRVRGFIFVYLY